MPSLADYESDLNRALIDAAANPVFTQFMQPDDFELIAVDIGGGIQAQAQALSIQSIRRVLDRMMQQARQKGVDIKEWICSPIEFDLCAKLKNTKPGQVIRALHDFLRNKKIEGTFAIIVFIPAPSLHPFLEIFCAVGFINNAFVELCDCDEPSKG
jgi:hypothetical protein